MSFQVSEDTFQRLPTNVVPKKYFLSLNPDLDNYTFTGEEKVHVEVKEPTNTITVNVARLSIEKASYELPDKSQLVAQDLMFMDADERLIITFPQTLLPGPGILHIRFAGELNDKLKGFYRSKCQTSDGSSAKYIAVTQFASTYARFAFPCWDEPAVKATFKLTLGVPANYAALSNMPQIDSTDNKDKLPGTDPKRNFVTFEETPIMSTYLLAFVVGPFDFVETITKNGIKVRAFTAPGKKEQGQFALKVAALSLDYYTEYFKIPYPLPKMDLIAIPEFACGAMENWGLTTFRETTILVDLEKSSADRKQRIALIVAHEMAHQWFGNLVTMEWWTHLWLNEGFATFMEYLCVESFMPEYSVWKQFVCSEYSTALKLDGLNNSHPVEVPITSPSEIDEIFDAISYSKGASIIAMLHDYIGDEAFRKGMTAYLNQFRYKNAQTEDLWNSLEGASSKTVKDVMSTWTKQKGYPVISVSQTKEGTTRKLKLSQEKFVENGILPENERDVRWMVPISVITSTSPEKSVLDHLLCNASDEILVPNVSPDDWIKLNKGSIGVYRIAYSEDMLQALIPAIESKALPPLDRLNILDDLFALVMAGKASTVQFLKVLQAFKNEDDYNVWSAVTSCIARLNSLLSHSDFHDSFQNWARSLLENIRIVGWDKKEDETHSQTLLRLVILSTLNSLDDPIVLSESKKFFDDHLNNSFNIPPDVRAVVYNAVSKQADEELFEILLKVRCFDLKSLI